MSETKTEARTIDRIDLLAKMIAGQCIEALGGAIADSGRSASDYEEELARIARAAIGDSPLRFPDELVDPVDPASIVDLVFDGPPAFAAGGVADGPRLLDLEDRDGNSVSVGEWIDTADGRWRLRIPTITLGVNFISARPTPSALAMPPTKTEAELVGRATALADYASVVGKADAEAVRDLVLQVVEESRWTRAIAQAGREIMFRGFDERVISQDELVAAHKVVGRWLEAAKTESPAIDAAAADLLVRAYIERVNALADLIDTWIEGTAKKGELRCAYCAKATDAAEMPGHAATCAMSPIVGDLRAAKDAHASACSTLAEVWHAATGVPWGNGPKRGIVEDVEDRIRDLTNANRPITRYDDGGTVWLESYSGGQHDAGAWGELVLQFVDAAGAETFRMYKALGPARARTEEERKEIYDGLVAGGLSSYEAAATAWPEPPASITLADVRAADAQLRKLSGEGERCPICEAPATPYVVLGDHPAGPRGCDACQWWQGMPDELAYVARVKLERYKADLPHRDVIVGPPYGEHTIDKGAARPPGEAGRADPPPRIIRQRGGATHTYALMEVSAATHSEVLGKLRAAGYDHAVHCGRDEHDGQARLDMSGIALVTIA